MTTVWELEAARALLTLREILVRHDENWKAHQLLQECVPYIVAHRRDIQQAKSDQAAMVAHAIDPAAGKAYYDTNPGDAPFEQQYGLKTAGDIFKTLPRFKLVMDTITQSRAMRVLDLACNDGVLAAALTEVQAGVITAGIDLSQACIDRAIARKVPAAKFECGSILDAAHLFPPTSFDLVVMFEVLEHVLEPDKFLQVAGQMVKPGGTLLVSTPQGAMEKGELSEWDRVEPKGHIWAWTVEQFDGMLAVVSEDRQVLLGPDNVMIGQVRL